MAADPSTPARYSIHDLATLASVPTRTVRFYIAQGLMDRPHGAKRGAWYEERHLQQLLLIRRWTDAGLSLDRVRELQAGSPEEAPPRPVKPGMVEVVANLGVTLKTKGDQAQYQQVLDQLTALNPKMGEDLKNFAVPGKTPNP